MTRGPLSRLECANAALAVLASGRTLSMRTVADELGVSTMAAYRHVTGRKHLGREALDRAFELYVDETNRRGRLVGNLDDLVLDAIAALEPYPRLAEELAHAFDGQAEPPHALAEWSTAIAEHYGPGAVRLAAWLVRGALGSPDPRAARSVAVLAAADVAARHEDRHPGHTALGVAKAPERPA